jgi:hypothetical protein
VQAAPRGVLQSHASFRWHGGTIALVRGWGIMGVLAHGDMCGCLATTYRDAYACNQIRLKHGVRDHHAIWYYALKRRLQYQIISYSYYAAV